MLWDHYGLHWDAVAVQLGMKERGPPDLPLLHRACGSRRGGDVHKELLDAKKTKRAERRGGHACDGRI